MKCEKIQELLLTGYCDEHISDAEKKIVQRHVCECKLCAQFSEEIKVYAAKPFQNATQHPVPDTIWTNVYARIQREQKRQYVYAGPKEFFATIYEELRHLPKIAYGFSGALACFAILMFTLHMKPSTPDSARQYIQEQFLVFASEQASFFNQEESLAFSSVIEEFFL
jgi:hypothetical protein